MKTIAIILAGGVGSRMKSIQPKQFIEVDRIPIIVRTIQNFQNSPRIDSVLIVCLSDWIGRTSQLCQQYGLSKVRWVIPGGVTGHDSTRNAIFFLRDKITDDDFIVVHDAARPLLPEVIIDDMMDKAVAFGNACSSLPCHETLVVTDDQKSGATQVDRKTIRRVQTPQAYRYGLVYPLYQKAEAENLHDFVYINTLAIYYGIRIYFSLGFDNNIKITTKEDIALYRSLLRCKPEDLVR